MKKITNYQSLLNIQEVPEFIVEIVRDRKLPINKQFWLTNVVFERKILAKKQEIWRKWKQMFY